jgi:hypothetical protein
LRTTTLPFDLLAWCRRMSSDGINPIKAAEAAELLGVSESGYYAIEARCRTRSNCNATVVRLAMLLEQFKNVTGGAPIALPTARLAANRLPRTGRLVGPLFLEARLEAPTLTTMISTSPTQSNGGRRRGRPPAAE